jgi:hydroxymethylbilane synthase
MDRPTRPLRLGSRGSPLALAQARSAAAAIEAAHGWEDGAVEIVPITTTGDRVQDRPLAELGGKALWTRELDRALIEGELDACVHSMKDVESARPETLRIAAMLKRADVRDRLIGAGSLDRLRDGAVVGTSSPRRAAQLLRIRPDLSVVPIRGNVETRLKKVASGEVEATLLAAAGLDRLGIATGEPLDTGVILPAPGQAAIGIECRSADLATIALVGAIGDQDTIDCVTIERAFTRGLGASCASPVAALARADGGELLFRAELLSADGAERVADDRRFERGDEAAAEALGEAMLAGAPEAIRTLFAGQ